MTHGVPEAAAAALLEVRDLRVRFRRQYDSIPAVDGLSYRIFPGRTLAIVGESGSGKTVCCRALMGLLPPTASITGSALLEGEQILGLPEPAMRRHRGAHIAMVFQDPARSLNPTMRIGQQIVEVLRQHGTCDRRFARDRAIGLLERLRVPAPSQRFFAYPHELSGGLRQRVVIAIAIAGNPRLLIADEATSSLDVITQAATLQLLKELQRQSGMALILVSHDLRLAAHFADDVLVMYAGRAVEYAATQRLFAHPRMRYTRALLDAMPRPEQPPHTLFPVIPGHPPDLACLPAGCAFEPRCAWARDVCKDARPPLEPLQGEHRWACWHPCKDEVQL